MISCQKPVGKSFLSGEVRAILNHDPLRAAMEALPWDGELHLLDSVGSTNDYAKALARQGAPHGTMVLAEEQTAGRGRLGRSFSSPRGLGLYASFLLRPGLPPGELLHVTAMAAVAACRAVEVVGCPTPRVKWTNDLILGGKKLGGVLAECSAGALVLGFGINVGHQPEDFPPDLRGLAASLRSETGRAPSRTALAICLAEEVCRLSEGILSRKAAYLRQYEDLCLTVGRDILLHRDGACILAHCTGLDGNGALLVRYADGREETVCSGDVSVRGTRGYL